MTTTSVQLNLPIHHKHSRLQFQMVYTCRILPARLFSDTKTGYHTGLIQMKRNKKRIEQLVINTEIRIQKAQYPP